MSHSSRNINTILYSQKSGSHLLFLSLEDNEKRRHVFTAEMRRLRLSFSSPVRQRDGSPIPLVKKDSWCVRVLQTQWQGRPLHLISQQLHTKVEFDNRRSLWLCRSQTKVELDSCRSLWLCRSQTKVEIDYCRSLEDNKKRRHVFTADMRRLRLPFSSPVLQRDGSPVHLVTWSKNNRGEWEFCKYRDKEVHSI